VYLEPNAYLFNKLTISNRTIPQRSHSQAIIKSTERKRILKQHKTKQKKNSDEFY